MNVNERQKDHKPLKISLNGMIILFSIAWAAIGFFWRQPFTVGDMGGVYWFLYYFEKLSSPFATLAFATTFLLVVIAIFMRVAKRNQFSSIMKTTAALFLASLMFGISSFNLFEYEVRHLDSEKIDDNLYYLTAYSAFDTNYALYQCDSEGILCRQLYRSNDYMPGWFHANLVYYATTGELAIEVKDRGEIYRQKIP